MKNIRNFCIIAHIDHGKSTLADRLLQWTNTVSERDSREQVLDDMDLERERGITIKSHAIQMNLPINGENYVLNLIDTPGHVDFSYEVSRAIAACEGALLVVDATQGIQAQTISNLYLAIDNDLTIIPVVNKIDMDAAMVEEVKDQIVELLGCEHDEILAVSAKTGIGIEDVLQAIVKRIPCPKGDPDAPLQALIFDSLFNQFRGVIAYFRVFNGTLRKNDHVKFFATQMDYHADEVGILRLKPESRDAVYADDYEVLRDSLEKLKLNDAALSFEPEASAALGFGFRCGFLGLLHMEIVQERLDREFDMDVITTVPNVSYKVYNTKGEVLDVYNPSGLPEPNHIEKIEEPTITANIITKADYIGGIMTLCIGKRGILKNQVYLTTDRIELTVELPLGEIVFDFYDKLKSISKGYASFDYHPSGWQTADLVKLDILLNGEVVDALSALITRNNAYDFGRRFCEKLKEYIPRQQYDVAIQAAIGAKVIARETVKAVRKDVTAKCYGGDITRKRKLLEKQKKGKKRMRQIGNVEVPQKAFLAVLKLDS